MSYKLPAALAAGLAAVAVAVAAPVASAAVTAAPLTIAQNGGTVSFTVTSPAGAGGFNAVLVAPAGSGAATFVATMGYGGWGAAKVGGSTLTCQVTGDQTAAPLTDVPDPVFPADGSSYTWNVPAADLPASFDAKAIVAEDVFDADGCTIDDAHHGVATGMADAQRFPVPAPVVTTPVGTPTPPPAPAPAPAPVVTTPTKPAADPDKDGIKNDWLVGGKPAAAPSAPKVSRTTAHGAVLTLPKAPKGGTIRVFARVAGTGEFKAVTAKVDKKTGKATISGLKAGQRYEIKVVAADKAGRQTQASKAVTVKTKKR
jgi:hypothetical protein